MARYEELDPEFRQAVFERLQKQVPYWNLLGLELVDMKKGWARLRLPFSEKLGNAGGIAHGGAIFSLADAAVGTALTGIARKNASISTIEMKINYIRPFSSGCIYAEAVILHNGRNTALGEVTVTDGEESLVARAMATYAVICKY